MKKKLVLISLISTMALATSTVFATSEQGDPVNPNTIVNSGEEINIDYPELNGFEISDIAITDGSVPIDDGSANIVLGRAVTAKTTDAVNFRKEASTSSTVYCTIPSGTEVKVIDSTSSSTWCKIEFKMQGDWFAKSGYVYKSYLKF